MLDDWLTEGVRLIQLRAKHLTLGPFLAIASAMAARCRDAGAVFIVNDRADVAALSGASGVHVGQDDLPVDAARRLVGPGLVGVSTHAMGQVHAAIDTSADYLAIGPVFGTSTKTNPDPVVGTQGVTDAAAVARAGRRPLVAIGGITVETAPAVIAAGADAVAVISDLLAGNPRERVREYLRVLSAAPPLRAE